ncbi:MAG: dTDP-4-dehydrorhamnose 3,5-epimerase family protein [Lachnospiraceae bacterium]|nr:dTDP-4-dehydrorhamnose 3,5-epimerase family protein [Lachnospiraceae bacterium]
MELVKEIFNSVKIYRLATHVDNRGTLSYAYDGIEGFEVKETRFYNMPHKGTFFGIHYREEVSPMSKLITLVKGGGMDYVIDLRKDSETYLKCESIELTEDNYLAVLIPAGIGHAFLSTKEDTIQAFFIDRCGNDGYSKRINYKDEKIGLKLPIPVSEIADYDLKAPTLE